MNQRPVAGIDVSKHFSDMCLLAPDNTIFTRQKIYHDLTSMTRSLSFLEEAERQFSQKPIIVMESTAHYHRIIANFFRKFGYEVIVINPMQSNAIKNISIRKIKSDKTDALRIAQLYRLNAVKPTNIPDKVLADLRDLCRQRKSLSELNVAYTNKLNAMLDEVFPGFKKVFHRANALSALSLLSELQTPQSVLDSDPTYIAKIINKGAGRCDNGKYGTKKAAILLETADSAIQISTNRAAMSSLIKVQADMIIIIKENIVKLEKAILEVSSSDKTINDNIQLLESIPGIGRLSATFLLAEIGDFSMFKKPKQLVAFCGLDPSVQQSGTMNLHSTKITKCGSSTIRAILDMCTHVAIHPNQKKETAGNPVLAAYYEKKKAVKPPKVAKCACMRKMVLIIFAVLRDQKPFELRDPIEHAKGLHSAKNQLAA